MLNDSNALRLALLQFHLKHVALLKIKFCRLNFCLKSLHSSKR